MLSVLIRSRLLSVTIVEIAASSSGSFTSATRAQSGPFGRAGVFGFGDSSGGGGIGGFSARAVVTGRVVAGADAVVGRVVGGAVAPGCFGQPALATSIAKQPTNQNQPRLTIIITQRMIQRTGSSVAEICNDMNPRIRSTTILTVRRDGKVALGGDGQVTLGDAIVKSDAKKIRRLADGKVLAGFAGSAADAFALLERFDAKLEQFKGSTRRAAIELAKEWRTDRALRRLESMLLVADAEVSLMIGGSGDVIEPTDGILAIGSGGSLALAAARALNAHSTLPARRIVEESLRIAGAINIYANQNIVVDEL